MKMAFRIKVRFLGLLAIVLISLVPISSGNPETKAEAAISAVKALKIAMNDANVKAKALTSPASNLKSAVTDQSAAPNATKVNSLVVEAVAAVGKAEKSVSGIAENLDVMDNTFAGQIDTAVTHVAAAKSSMDSVEAAVKVAVPVISELQTVPDELKKFTDAWKPAKTSMDTAAGLMDSTKKAVDKAKSSGNIVVGLQLPLILLVAISLLLVFEYL